VLSSKPAFANPAVKTLRTLRLKIGLQNKYVHSEMGIAFSEYFTGPFSGIVF